MSDESINSPESVHEREPSDDAIAKLDPEAALSLLAKLIDAADDSKQIDELERCMRLGEALRPQLSSASQSAILDYFLANAWHALFHARSSGQTHHKWERPELEMEILLLRRAALAIRNEGVPAIRACQILTNLGNALSSIGRCAEALAAWNRALQIDAEFAMALGNRAHGIIRYGSFLHDKHHQHIFLHEAYSALRSLPTGAHPQAIATFEADRQWIEGRMSRDYLNRELVDEGRRPGQSAEEVSYRQWCVDNVLFLNPLNDIVKSTMSSSDVITLPTIRTALDEGPSLIGFFNQMVQEYVSARFFYFSGRMRTKVHYSDRQVTLFNTFDYPAYTLGTEEIKSAFRSAYSIFDKIAYFLNEYFSLGIKHTQVTFKTLWYNSRNRDKGIRKELSSLGNAALLSLFWIAKDLYEDEAGFREVMEPSARDLDKIRQHAEHKYLKIHDVLADPGPGLRDTLAYSVTRGTLIDSTMTVLRLARSGLIYLALAVTAEERRRAKSRPADETTVPMTIPRWEDDWKA